MQSEEKTNITVTKKTNSQEYIIVGAEVVRGPELSSQNPQSSCGLASCGTLVPRDPMPFTDAHVNYMYVQA